MTSLSTYFNTLEPMLLAVPKAIVNNTTFQSVLHTTYFKRGLQLFAAAQVGLVCTGIALKISTLFTHTIPNRIWNTPLELPIMMKKIQDSANQYILHGTVISIIAVIIEQLL